MGTKVEKLLFEVADLKNSCGAIIDGQNKEGDPQPPATFQPGF